MCALRAFLPSYQSEAYGLESPKAAILHAASDEDEMRSPRWEPMQEQFFRDSYLKGRFTDHRDLTFITYNTHGTPGVLEHALTYIGLSPPVVLGTHLTDDDWDWSCKVTLVDEYLRSGACTSRYVACLDDDDVLVFESPGSIIEKFEATSAQILFCRGSDWPPTPSLLAFERSAYHYLTTDTNEVSLNANYIGEREYIAERVAELASYTREPNPMYWDQVCEHYSAFDDQLAWRQFQKRFWPAIRTDVAASLFTELR